MTITTDNTIILFGRSLFINEIREYIPYLIEKYHTIGINHFVESYPDIENVIYFDDIFINGITAKHNVITDIRHYQNKNSKSYLFLKEHEKKELYLIRRDFSSLSTDTNTLHFFFHTPTIAINWAYLKGFENVILLGVDITDNKEHFDVEYLAEWKDDVRVKARKHLEQVCTKYINIYNVNVNNGFELPQISITEL